MSKMESDFVPKREIEYKCAAFRLHIYLISHLEYNQFPFLDTRTHRAPVQIGVASSTVCLEHTSGRVLFLKKREIIKYVQPKGCTNIYVALRKYISLKSPFFVNKILSELCSSMSITHCAGLYNVTIRLYKY